MISLIDGQDRSRIADPMFDEIHHADWSMGARKRWVASARRTDAGWAAFGPRRVGPAQAFLDELAGAALTHSLVSLNGRSTSPERSLTPDRCDCNRPNG
jgi:hypothetical protein